MSDIVILAVESSCDDTSAAVIKNGKVLSNCIAGQEVHRLYGGVIPELASRAHQEHIVPVVHRALSTANIHKSSLNAVAFTQGPGLLGSLLVGVSFCKSFGNALGIPLIAVNHMHAHVMAHFIDEPRPRFPFLCLTVSGGHTQILRVDAPNEMTVLGLTRDDAVGEAFDKAAKMMGLPYPGGPLVDKYAALGNSDAYAFPDTDMPGLDYSFSGIKTGFLNFLKKNTATDPDFVEKNMNDICASLQAKLIKMLFQKLEKAVEQTSINRVAIAGGVSANSGLRAELQQRVTSHGWEVFIPDFQYCTDNAGMIAISAHYKYLAGEFAPLSTSPMPRMPM